jgi:hypothetical protein
LCISKAGDNHQKKKNQSPLTHVITLSAENKERKL